MPWWRIAPFQYKLRSPDSFFVKSISMQNVVANFIILRDHGCGSVRALTLIFLINRGKRESPLNRACLSNGVPLDKGLASAMGPQYKRATDGRVCPVMSSLVLGPLSLLSVVSVSSKVGNVELLVKETEMRDFKDLNCLIYISVGRRKRLGIFLDNDAVKRAGFNTRARNRILIRPVVRCGHIKQLIVFQKECDNYPQGNPECISLTWNPAPYGILTQTVPMVALPVGSYEFHPEQKIICISLPDFLCTSLAA